MKKFGLIIICALLILSGCIPSFDDNDDEVLQNDEELEGQRSIVPSYRLSDEYYRMILPYRTSEARGAITRQIANRLDIGAMEEGLRRHSMDHFAPDAYFFEEGQYLDRNTVLSWIDEFNPTIEDRSDEDEFRENPRHLSHILEHNFLQRTEEDEQSIEIKGVSIALALKSVYRFNTEDGRQFYEDISYEDMMEKGQEIAQTVLERLRQQEELNDVPIMIAIYREASQGSGVPGNFVAKTFVEGGNMFIGEWESIDEEYILFPSGTADSKYFDDAQMVNNFATDIAEFFPNYVGVIGKGFYIEGQLQKLTLEIPIEFYGKGEVIGLSQYAYSLIKEKFTGDYYDLEVNISSSQGQEALIIRSAGEDDPIVHVYH